MCSSSLASKGSWMNNICSYENSALDESKIAKRHRIVEASYGTDLTLKEFAACQGVGYSMLVKPEYFTLSNSVKIVTRIWNFLSKGHEFVSS